MPELHHHPLSAASRSIRLLLAEYGIEPVLKEEEPWAVREEFFDINPAGSVPVYLPGGGRPVVGARTIAEYVDETTGAMQIEGRLFPEGVEARAEMRRIADWALGKLENEAITPLFRERVLKRRLPASEGGGAPDSAALRTARSQLRFHQKYLGWLAINRNWLAGSRMSYADLAVAAGLSVLDYLGEVEWAEDDGLREWYARMKSRPSFRPLLADRLRGLPPVSHYADLDF